MLGDQITQLLASNQHFRGQVTGRRSYAFASNKCAEENLRLSYFQGGEPARCTVCNVRDKIRALLCAMKCMCINCFYSQTHLLIVNRLAMEQ